MVSALHSFYLSKNGVFGCCARKQVGHTSLAYNAYVTCMDNAADKAQRHTHYVYLKCDKRMKNKEAYAQIKTKRTEVRDFEMRVR